jgi:osmotically-inducible protein OsmY
VTDEELTKSVVAALAEDSKVDSTLIDVMVDGGEVLLRGTVGSFWQQRADAELRADVLHALSLNGMIPSTVDASVDDGTVLLSGTVDQEHQREEAVRVAGNVPGVVEVDNDLFLNPPLPDAQG